MMDYFSANYWPPASTFDFLLPGYSKCKQTANPPFFKHMHFIKIDTYCKYNIIRIY